MQEGRRLVPDLAEGVKILMTRISGYISNGENCAAERAYSMLNNQTNGFTDLKSRWICGSYEDSFVQNSVGNRPKSPAKLPGDGYRMAVGYSAQGSKIRKGPAKGESQVKGLLMTEYKAAGLYYGGANDGVFQDLERELNRGINVGERIQKFMEGQDNCCLIYVDGVDGRMFAGASGRARLVAGYDGSGWGVASDWGGLTQTKTNDYKVEKMMLIEDGVVELRPEKKTPRIEIAVAPVPKTV